MKKLFSLFAILALVSGVAYAYDADGNPNTKREVDGAPAWVPYREYQLVRWAENSPGTSTWLTAGDVVVRDCISDDGVTIGLVATASTDAVAGVVVSVNIPTADSVGTTAQTDYGRRNWGYIQVSGHCAKVNVTGGGAAGSTLVASTTARYATAPNGVPASGQKALGFAYDASSQGQAEAYINL